MPTNVKVSTGRLAAERTQLPVLGNIQALRAIAALLVVLIHASLSTVGVESVLASGEPPWLAPFQYIGLFGVDLFFVISGFIMLVTTWNSLGDSRAGFRFFVRRAIRIYPPYWFALVPALAVLALAKDRFMVSHVGVQTGVLQSILLLPNPNKFVLTVAWTLVWEMIFYAVFALLIRFNKKQIGFALIGWFIVQVALYFAFKNSANFYLNFVATPLPMEFIFGTFVGLGYVHNVFPAPRVVASVCIAFVGLMCFTVVSRHIALLDINDVKRVLIFGLSAMLLVYAGVALEASRTFVAPRAMVRLGDGSYAIYLWHISILVALRQIIKFLHPAGPLAHTAVIAVSLAIITACGLAVYNFFERPVTSYLNKILGLYLPRPLSAAAKISASIGPSATKKASA